MRLRIEHTTIYAYSRPVQFGRHRLVLRPREGHDIHIEQMELRLDPEAQVMWVRDVFGNSIALVDWLQPAERLTISSQLVVERVAPFPHRELHQPWRIPFPVRYDPLETAVTAVYQQLSFPEFAAPVQTWLRQAMTPDPHDAEGTMLALCELVHRTIRYQHRSASGVQTPARTLDVSSGSCRDIATLMMEAARLFGIAARFASGYLHGTASLAGHASTHAWCEVYLPTLGWRGFDPTIGATISLNHIVTGVSTHPRGVMPVSGTFHGSRIDCQSMSAVVKTAKLSD